MEEPTILSMDVLYAEVGDALRTAEADVRQREADLAAARERLAAARGQLELLNRMQQQIASGGKAREA